MHNYWRISVRTGSSIEASPWRDYSDAGQTGHDATYLLSGSNHARVAGTAMDLLQRGARVVLLPGKPRGVFPTGIWLNLGPAGKDHPGRTIAGQATRADWDLAMFSSGSTGVPQGYGFQAEQLSTVCGWYERIYGVTRDSAIVTSLPATYNFAFIAGVLLASQTGATIHFSQTPESVFDDAALLAERSDRVIVLANPVALEAAAQAIPHRSNILIDSGGAPLTRHAIAHFRARGFDLREGYGLTETASLTHFDQEGTDASLGTVGAAMPGVEATISRRAGKPQISLSGAVLGRPLDLARQPLSTPIETGDLGALDSSGRLRILGRASDECINNRWPRDTLDHLGPDLQHRCALVVHQQDSVTVRLLARHDAVREAIRRQVVEYLNLPPEAVRVEGRSQSPLLHSRKLVR